MCSASPRTTKKQKISFKSAPAIPSISNALPVSGKGSGQDGATAQNQEPRDCARGLQLLASLLYVHREPHGVAAQELQVTPPAANTHACLLPQQPRFLTLGFGCACLHVAVAMQISLLA